MNKITRIFFFAVLLSGTAFSAMADRGSGKKSKSSKITLNIVTPSTLRNSLSINLKYGLKYSGSILANNQGLSGATLRNSLVTYQKGNTTYIIPYKQKIVMPEVRPGYTGVKLIIRPN
jgi:hypothetical protein